MVVTTGSEYCMALTPKDIDPNALKQPMVGIAYDGPSQRDQFHSHSSAQLLYSVSGIIEVQVDHQLFIVPPSNAVWIPPQVSHRSLSSKPIQFRSLYIDSKYCTTLSQKTCVVLVDPLLKALIERVCVLGSCQESDVQAWHLTQVILDELSQMDKRSFQLNLSSNEIMLKIYDFLQAPGNWSLSADQVSFEFGMSTKTLVRLFQKETGMTFHQWATQVKLVLAMAWLSDGVSITQVAHQLSYSSDSAFIAQFKRYFAVTPGEFVKQSHR